MRVVQKQGDWRSAVDMHAAGDGPHGGHAASGHAAGHGDEIWDARWRQERKLTEGENVI